MDPLEALAVIRETKKSKNARKEWMQRLKDIRFEASCMHVYVCIDACMFIHLRIDARTYECMYVSVYIYTCVCTCAHGTHRQDACGDVLLKKKFERDNSGNSLEAAADEAAPAPVAAGPGLRL